MGKSITLFEHEPLYYRDDKCLGQVAEEEQEINRFADKLEKINRNLFDKAEIIKVGRRYIKASQYVGVIKVGRYTVTVLPKIFSGDDEEAIKGATRNLLYMLQYTKKLKIKEVDIARLKKVPDDFFEILIYLFAKNFLDIAKLGLSKRYEPRHENIRRVKGKILFGEDAKRNYADRSRTYCRYYEFTEDTLLNHAIKYTTIILKLVSRNPDNQRLLGEAALLLENVEFRHVSPSELRKVTFSRLNERYKPIFELCKLFIENSSIQLSTEKVESFSLLFDMNKLFEEFIGEFLRKHKDDIFEGKPVQISLQKGKYLCEKNYFLVKPDIYIVIDVGEEKIILDTKYKELSMEDRKFGISSSDMYQMLTYGITFDSYKLILLYPKIRGVEEKPYFIKPFKELKSLEFPKELQDTEMEVQVKWIDLKNIDLKKDKDKLKEQFKKIFQSN
jgi:5-methylcytosine-specific restriction enzyme subunit McrC